MSNTSELNKPEFSDDGSISRIQGDGYNLYQYPDYETYREIQNEGNRRKIKWQYVQESHIQLCAKFIEETVSDVEFGLCHGTRSGAEQAWFSKALKNAPKVIGTEISDSATDFPNTVQWDFHNRNPEWHEKADFVYSNSWDHAFDPLKAFGGWFDSLKSGGLLLLDHSDGHTARKANKLDAFGIRRGRLQRLLRTQFADVAEPMDALDFTETNPEYPVHVVVMRKR